MVLVAPSILSADFSRLGQEVRSLEKAGADLIHIDVMDGHFVPNLTFGAGVVRDIRKCVNVPFDVHLMMTNPSDFIPDFAAAGADIITVHLECGQNIADLIDLIKKEGKKVGISLRPKTKVSDIIPWLPMIDLVLVMSVEPGFGGQTFQKEAISRIAELKDLIGRKQVQISVDGGINNVTAPACVLAGADILVAGNYILGHKPYARAIKALKG
jgi:ribulose-phosphate 3-epimerase